MNDGGLKERRLELEHTRDFDLTNVPLVARPAFRHRQATPTFAAQV
jgi:hypothetical protein